MSENEKSAIPDEVPKSARDIEHELDIHNSRIFGQFPIGESNKAVDEEARELILEVDEFLERELGVLESREEYDKLLRKLDTAIAITNEPYARELRQRLVEQFG